MTDLGACPATLLPDLTAPTEDEVREAVAASAKAGCTELSIWAQHVPWMGDLSALGLRVRVLEGATAWANGSASEADAEAETFAELASTLAAPLVMAFALDPKLADPNATRRNLGGLVAAVEQVGARVCLEFLPFGGVPDLAAAWQLIEPLGPGAALNHRHLALDPSAGRAGARAAIDDPGRPDRIRTGQRRRASGRRRHGARSRLRSLAPR